MNNKNNENSISKIETNGVEQIPDHERTAGPRDLFRLIFGGANTFATAVLGSFPVLFGLSFQAGVWAIVLGVLVGAVILAPMGLFGPINGTNNAVSSGAHFGVHGRIVGSFLSLLTAIAFFSLSVWSSGDALVGGAKRLVGLPETDLSLGLAYGLFAVLVLTVCIYGFRFMLWVNRIAVWAASLLFLLGIVAFAPAFDGHFAGTVALGQPGFWAAFIGAALVAMSNPVSFGAFLGDWSRYIPRETPKRRIMVAVIGAQLATLIPFLFGLATATIVAVKAPDYITANNYVGGLLAVAPTWFFLPVCLIAVIGGMSTGTTSLYGTGLDMSSVFPRLLSRVKATLLIGVMSIAFIFIGRFAANLVQSVSTFAVLIITCTTPWLDGDDDHWPDRTPGLLLPGRPASVHPRRNRRALLVQPRLELARHGRLDPECAGGPVLRQPAGAICRAAGQPGRWHRHQPAGDPGPGLADLPEPAAPVPGTGRGLWPE
ncbi:MAG: hypothetical protein GAK32_00534 [Pseudomonas fluorescens]|nr:MAG: hypothetical protein GAK32_00534 [Pseudomonas fluorescens]